jgi:hypothetical protein
LLAGELIPRVRDNLTRAPLAFFAVGEGHPSYYAFDFDRDGLREWVLENDRLRLIVSPASGGRVIALVDKHALANLITNVGASLDLFPGTTSSDPRAENFSEALNRPWRAQWLRENGATSLHLASPDAQETNGLQVEKTIRLRGEDSLEVDYLLRPPARQALASSASSSTAAAEWLNLTSLPARVRGERSTRFCWVSSTESTKKAATPDTKPGDADGSHCTRFEPNGKTLELPPEANRLEVITPGQPGLAMEWDTGTVVIEMKEFSALVKLRPAVSAATGESARFHLRYTVLPVE